MRYKAKMDKVLQQKELLQTEAALANSSTEFVEDILEHGQPYEVCKSCKKKTMLIYLLKCYQIVAMHKQMLQKLDEISPVNWTVPSVNEKMQFLSNQKDELKGSIASFGKIVGTAPFLIFGQKGKGELSFSTQHLWMLMID